MVKILSILSLIGSFAIGGEVPTEKDSRYHKELIERCVKYQEYDPKLVEVEGRNSRYLLAVRHRERFALYYDGKRLDELTSEVPGKSIPISVGYVLDSSAVLKKAVERHIMADALNTCRD